MMLEHSLHDPVAKPSPKFMALIDDDEPAFARSGPSDLQEFSQVPG
jgi:hypothetical protein